MGHQEMGLQLKKPGVDEQGQDGYWKVGLGAGERGCSTVLQPGRHSPERPAEKENAVDYAV